MQILVFCDDSTNDFLRWLRDLRPLGEDSAKEGRGFKRLVKKEKAMAKKKSKGGKKGGKGC